MKKVISFVMAVLVAFNCSVWGTTTVYAEEQETDLEIFLNNTAEMTEILETVGFTSSQISEMLKMERRSNEF